jgi:hypothetical protein
VIAFRLKPNKDNPMFRGKEPAHQFAVHVLTADYFIEGQIPTNMTWHSPVVLEVNSASYQPTGNFTLSAGSTLSMYVQQNALVAIMPQDEACATDMLKVFLTKQPLKTTILLNHYQFSGTAFATSDNLSTLSYTDAILMQDAQIECLVANAQCKAWKEPLALIYTRKMLQGLFASP